VVRPVILGKRFPSITGLTTNTWGEGTDPTVVDVTDGGTATDNTGYREALNCNIICDVEPVGGDGDVDRGDIGFIFRHRGQVVSPPGAANSGDCNGDGVLAIDDARACQAFYH